MPTSSIPNSEIGALKEDDRAMGQRAILGILLGTAFVLVFALAVVMLL